MIPIPTFTEILLPLLFIAFIFLFFLPAILELKRPKDAEPRRIANVGLNSLGVENAKLGLSSLPDLEEVESESFKGIVVPNRNPIFALVNIEAF